MLSQGAVIPFLSVGIAWLLAGCLAAVFATHHANPAVGTSTILIWMASLWLLCMLDLLTAGMAFQAVFQLITSHDRASWIVQAMIWGTLKLVCLAALAMVLMRAQAAPQWALVLGISTLVVVPTIAGIWWSRGEARGETGQDLVIDSGYLYDEQDNG